MSSIGSGTSCQSGSGLSRSVETAAPTNVHWFVQSSLAGKFVVSQNCTRSVLSAGAGSACSENVRAVIPGVWTAGSLAQPAATAAETVKMERVRHIYGPILNSAFVPLVETLNSQLLDGTSLNVPAGGGAKRAAE